MSHHHKHEPGQGHSPSNDQKSQEALAYHLWEQAGRPEGQSARFWRDAEEQLKRSPQPEAGDSHLHHKGHGDAH
jgi:hypothetical protein